jgi:hypothetical protein
VEPQRAPLAAPHAAIALVAAQAMFAACAAPTPPTPAAGPAAVAAPTATASDASSAPASSPSAPPASPTEVLAKDRAAFDSCYARARATDPKLGRTSVEMTFTIDAEGTPRTVDLQYRHRMDDRAKECLRDAALALRFPPSMQGTRAGTIVFTPPPPTP